VAEDDALGDDVAEADVGVDALEDALSEVLAEVLVVPPPVHADSSSIDERPRAAAARRDMWIRFIGVS
jgi:hypothetical protein